VKKQWDNLRPFEKRVVVAVLAMLFIVFNFWFVFPHFSDWGRVQFRMEKAQRTLAMFQTELAQTNKYSQEIKKLQSEGLSVPPEDQSLHFSSTILTRAAQSGVNVLTTSRTSTRTNDQFFIEQSQTISTQSTEQQLVDFLYGLGSGDSLVRVRDLGLRPDPPHYALVGTITLVASYQKKPQAKSSAPPARGSVPQPGPPAAKPPAPSAKPATSSPNPAASPAKPGAAPGKPGMQTNKPANKPLK
jgi:hypothetical protein